MVSQLRNGKAIRRLTLFLDEENDELLFGFFTCDRADGESIDLP